MTGANPDPRHSWARHLANEERAQLLGDERANQRTGICLCCWKYAATGALKALTNHRMSTTRAITDRTISGMAQAPNRAAPNTLNATPMIEMIAKMMPRMRAQFLTFFRPD